MSARVSFRCPTCSSKLRASLQFVGRACNCPKCGNELLVPPRVQDDEDTVLILDDGYAASQAAGRWNGW